MIAFAFGIESTRRDWLANTVVVALAVGRRALAFAAIGLVPVALGGAFLQYDLLPIRSSTPVKYGMEAVEVVGIAPIVAGVLMGGSFFLLARGFDSAEDGFGNSSFREEGPNDEGGSLEEEAADAGGDR